MVNSGLVLYLDASNPNSYAGTGTTWTDLSGYGNDFTLVNNPTFNTGNGGYLQFDGVDDYLGSSNADNLLIGPGSGSSYFVMYKPLEVTGKDGTLFFNANCVGKPLLSKVLTAKALLFGIYILTSSTNEKDLPSLVENIDPFLRVGT